MQITPVCSALVALFVLIIALYDVRERRIPNFLVFPAMLSGVILHLAWPIDGRMAGVKGVIAGFLLLVFPYATGGMKAGDVKFLMAIGALIGWQNGVNTLLAGLLTYPPLALYFVLREKKLLLTWLRFRRLLLGLLGFINPGARLLAMRLELQDTSGADSVRTPFGLSLAVGALIVLAVGGDWPVAWT